MCDLKTRASAPTLRGKKHPHTRVHMCTYVYKCVHMCIYMYICVYMCQYMNICMTISIHEYMCAPKGGTFAPGLPGKNSQNAAL